MKIGILTHHYICNFGAFLQAYSLQKTVREMLPDDEVYMIDYINVKHFIINMGGWFRFYKSRENLSNWCEKIKLPVTFSKARKKYLNLTATCYSAKDVEKLGLDTIIVGSDEVWNYQDAKGNAPVKFGVGLELEKLIAYAPSVGQSDPEDMPDYVREGIKKFYAVSARDSQTAELASRIRQEQIQRVADPTFLTRIPDEMVPGIENDYILFYYCDKLPEEEKQKIFAYAKQHNLAVYGAGECNKNYTATTVNLTPFQWVWMFRHAKFVVTGTFHGAVFSMLNHRQFCCYLTNPSRIRKVTSLLTEFDLQDRICSANAEQILMKLNENIDYVKAEHEFENIREKSKTFLQTALNPKEK